MLKVQEFNYNEVTESFTFKEILFSNRSEVTPYFMKQIKDFKSKYFGLILKYNDEDFIWNSYTKLTLNTTYPNPLIYIKHYETA